MTVPATVVPVKISKGQDKWGECAKVEESGEDGQDQEKNLLALAWTTGSRQSDDACDKAWNGDPKSFPDIDSPSGL